MVVLDKVDGQPQGLELVGAVHFHEEAALVLEHIRLEDHQAVEVAGSDLDLHRLLLGGEFKFSVYTKRRQSQADTGKRPTADPLWDAASITASSKS